MKIHPDPTNPCSRCHTFIASELSPEQRRTELAAILARGVLRRRKLQSRSACPPESPRASTDKSVAAPLDVPAETVLSVHDGLANVAKRNEPTRGHQHRTGIRRQFPFVKEA